MMLLLKELLAVLLVQYVLCHNYLHLLLSMYMCQQLNQLQLELFVPQGSINKCKDLVRQMESLRLE